MPQARIHALDAIRGIAALWVVLYHVVLRYPWFRIGEDSPATPLLPGHPAFFTVNEMGLIPVLWFFLISGFVITWTIDRCRTPMDFVVSRVSRLYPAYWTALAITVLLVQLAPLPGARLTLGQVLVNVTMLQDYLGVPPVSGVYWSLGVELRFYVFAVLLFALGQWRHVQLYALAWALAALLAALAAAAGLWVPWRLQQLLILPYAPLLVAGMMLYRLWRRQHPAWSWATLALAVAAIAFALRPAPVLSCLLVMAMIAWSARGGLRPLAAAPLVCLGTISYSLYLSHESVAYTIMGALEAAGWSRTGSQLVAVPAVFLLATAITFGAERPGLRAIRHLWRRASTPSLPSPAA